MLIKKEFSLMGGRIQTGNIDASFADNPFNMVVKPNNFHAMDLTFYFKPSYVGEKYANTTFGYEAKKKGVSMSKYDVEHKRVNDATKNDVSQALHRLRFWLLQPEIWKIIHQSNRFN